MARQVAEMKRSIGNPPGANIIANARQRAEVADLSKYMHENRPMPTPGFKPRPQNLEHRWTHNNNNGGHNSIIGHNDEAMNRLSGMKGAGALYQQWKEPLCDQSKDNSTTTCPPPMKKSRSLAFLATGLLTHGAGGFAPLSEPKQYNRIKQLLGELRSGSVIKDSSQKDGAYGISVDLFLHLELHQHPKKDLHNPAVGVEAVGSHAASGAVTSVPPSLLGPVLTALEPIKLSLHNEAPYCMQRGPRFCPKSEPTADIRYPKLTGGCTRAWPRWWEQMLKISRAMNLVREYERETQRMYGWVISMRADYNPFQPDHNSAAANILSVMMKARSRGVVRTKPFAGASGRIDSGYGQADWFWLALREDAEHVTSIASNASCEWLRCIGGTHATAIQNERVLVEWALKGGLSVAKMPPASLPTALDNLVTPQARYRFEGLAGLVRPATCDGVP